MNYLTARVLAVTVASAALLLFGCSPSSSDSVEAASVKPASERNTAPDFELKDVNGNSVKLSDYRGKVVLLNFWATWCGPCKIEIPWFIDLEKQYKDRGFAVLGISMDEDGWDSVRPYLDRAKVNYRVLMGTDTVAMLYGGIESLPTTFMIDREGRIASVHIGLVSRGDYENDVAALLQ